MCGGEMELDQHVIRRLAFIRYLFQTAVSQSYAPAPLKCASLLVMHDAVELWLQLASERVNVGMERTPFMEYWKLIGAKLDPQELSQKESMRRLNNARVALKHHGTFPSDSDLEAFRANTTSFFHENTPIVFGVNLDEVSLVEYVNPEASRELLKDAEADLAGGEVLNALSKIAIAYAEMIRDYEERKRTRFGRSPFYFGRDLTFQSAFFMGLKRGSSDERKLAEFVDRVRESIESMQDAMKVLALGVDYRKYSKFKRLTPDVHRMAGGSVRTIWSPACGERAATHDDVLFCLNFVIESALALVEFDYSLPGD
jgi:hypothetical protein